MRIVHHAVLYALIVKHVFETFRKDEAEEIVREITKTYGRKRGRRMKSHSKQGDLNDFFRNGEWKGEAEENESSMMFEEDETVSKVTKCAWLDAWKKYGLEEYGKYYCLYIDKAMCDGFEGSFSLDVKQMLSAGSESCLFVWNEKSDPVVVQEEKKHLMSFDEHCLELWRCAKDVLKKYGKENEMKKIREEFEELFPDFVSFT